MSDRGWEITYDALDHVSDEAAAGLAAHGVVAGDVVALVLPPSVDYAVAYLAAAKVGAVTAGVNDRLTPIERSAVLDRAAPRLVVAAAGCATGEHETLEVEPAARLADLLPALRRAGAGASTPLLPVPDDPDHPVAVVFTSGTTGAPKGALYCNRQLDFITETDVGDTWGGGGRSLSGTSFAHLGFMTKLQGNLQRGGVTHILSRWSALASLRLLSEHRMTTLAGVPAQIALMLRRPDFDDFDLESVQFIVVGGGPVTPGLVEEARERFAAALSTRYSCTEAGIGLGTAFDDPDEDAIVSVGRPHPSVELRVLDDQDRPVAAGDVGSVCLRSPAVMSGYWRDPDATRAAFTFDGFVRTGDLGWVDDRDRLRLVGRSKEMYVRGGYNVHPVEVEAVLSTHPGVAAIAIVPRADGVMGEIGVAVIVPRDPRQPPTLDALREHARDALTAYKLPEDLVVADSLPLTPMEKIDRKELAARISRPDEKADQ